MKTRNTFVTKRAGTGTKEWSDFSYNICSGCEHGCLYCYAKSYAGRFNPEMRVPGRWQKQQLTEKGRLLGKDMGKKGVVMFPTTHDITPNFLKESVETINNLLKNNKVLIVTKPHLEVIKRLCKELAKQKKKVMFRFTIGSLNEGQCAFWEPGAPKPKERVKAIQHAFKAEFQTSVSIEPMLDDNAGTRELVRAVDPYVTDTIWIGKMQRVPKTQNAHIDGFDIRMAFVKEWQKDANILSLVESLKANKKVEWKDGIKKVLKKHKKL